MKNIQFIRYVLIMQLFFVPLAFGAPHVQGNTISWPDNGWYQVQTANGLTSLCNGGRSCVVEPGIYIVINHTTGERFTDVVVSGGETGYGAPTVEGSVISWADDGWYQVQTADGLTSLCSGGQSCEVSNGTYIVINHTTGQRWEDVRVINNSNNTISVSGDTIYMPNDGWYEVQSADGSQVYCAGERQCTTGRGHYIVINHTSGSRDRVEVMSGQPPLNYSMSDFCGYDAPSRDMEISKIVGIWVSPKYYHQIHGDVKQAYIFEEDGEFEVVTAWENRCDVGESCASVDYFSSIERGRYYFHEDYLVFVDNNSVRHENWVEIANDQLRISNQNACNIGYFRLNNESDIDDHFSTWP